MSHPSHRNNDSVVGIEWHMLDLFNGNFDPSHAALAVLYHYRITQALLKYHNLYQHSASSLMQRRFHVGLYYEVVSGLCSELLYSELIITRENTRRISPC